MVLAHGRPRRNVEGNHAMTVAERLKLSCNSPHLTNGEAAHHQQKEEQPLKRKLDLSLRNKSTVRIIAQYLTTLGLRESVETLVHETGCKIENTHASKLRRAIYKGEWGAALETVENCRRYLTPAELNAIRLILLEEKFYQHIRDKQSVEALYVMRNDYPRGRDFEPKRAHMLKHLYLPANKIVKYPDLNRTRTVRQRQFLVERIQRMLPNSFMLPANRLEILINQAKNNQIEQCKADKLHMHKLKNLEEDTVLRDHTCHIPPVRAFSKIQTLYDHENEVYFVQFSPDGSLLASGSKNNFVIVWKVRPTRTVRRLRTFETLMPKGQISCMSWSHDNAFLAVAGSEQSDFECTVFNVFQGNVHRTIRCLNHNEINMHVPSTTIYTCCSFFAGTNRVLIAGNEKGHMRCYNMDKHLESHFIKQMNGFRVRCLYGFKDGNRILASDSHNRLRTYSLTGYDDKTVLVEEAPLISFAVHPSERLVLTTTPLNLRLWDIKTRTLVRYFSGACQQLGEIKYVVHATFGGFHRGFIATGGTSEDASLSRKKDGRVCIWDIDDCRPIMRLKGHRGMVNAVSWNPKDPSMLASCSEDGSVRIWNIHPAVTDKISSVLPRRKKAKQRNGGGKTMKITNGTTGVIVENKAAAEKEPGVIVESLHDESSPQPPARVGTTEPKDDETQGSPDTSIPSAGGQSAFVSIPTPLARRMRETRRGRPLGSPPLDDVLLREHLSRNSESSQEGSEDDARRFLEAQQRELARTLTPPPGIPIPAHLLRVVADRNQHPVPAVRRSRDRRGTPVHLGAELVFSEIFPPFVPGAQRTASAASEATVEANSSASAPPEPLGGGSASRETTNVVQIGERESSQELDASPSTSSVSEPPDELSNTSAPEELRRPDTVTVERVLTYTEQTGCEEEAEEDSDNDGLNLRMLIPPASVAEGLSEERDPASTEREDEKIVVDEKIEGSQQTTGDREEHSSNTEQTVETRKDEDIKKIEETGDAVKKTKEDTEEVATRSDETGEQETKRKDAADTTTGDAAKKGTAARCVGLKIEERDETKAEQKGAEMEVKDQEKPSPVEPTTGKEIDKVQNSLLEGDVSVSGPDALKMEALQLEDLKKEQHDMKTLSVTDACNFEGNNSSETAETQRGAEPSDQARRRHGVPEQEKDAAAATSEDGNEKHTEELKANSKKEGEEIRKNVIVREGHEGPKANTGNGTVNGLRKSEDPVASNSSICQESCSSARNATPKQPSLTNHCHRNVVHSPRERRMKECVDCRAKRHDEERRYRLQILARCSKAAISKMQRHYRRQFIDEDDDDDEEDVFLINHKSDDDCEEDESEGLDDNGDESEEEEEEDYIVMPRKSVKDCRRAAQQKKMVMEARKRKKEADARAKSALGAYRVQLSRSLPELSRVFDRYEICEPNLEDEADSSSSLSDEEDHGKIHSKIEEELKEKEKRTKAPKGEEVEKKEKPDIQISTQGSGEKTFSAPSSGEAVSSTADELAGAANKEEERKGEEDEEELPIVPSAPQEETSKTSSPLSGR